jgi:cytochrome c peroxidase
MAADKLSVAPGTEALQHWLEHFGHSPSRCGPRRRLAGRVLIKVPLLVAGALGALLFTAGAPYADIPLREMDLRTVPVPGPSQDVLKEYIVDKTAAIQLGKALFWDVRVGSDNKTACASCHSSAGADTREKNQISPGLLRRWEGSLAPNPDRTFQLGSGPNYKFKASDFPFTRFSDVSSNDPAQRMDINDVASSQGVFNGTFRKVKENDNSAKPDNCKYSQDPDNFHLGALDSRRVEPRNSPSVINAVFNFRNFWDGRANNVFNGGDPFGLRNPNALVWKNEAGILRKVKVAIESSSMASQGSGPPGSGTEMSCGGRAFVHIGQKLLEQKILDGQAIARDDSVLGQFANNRPSYESLVKRAFNPNYWQTPDNNKVRFTKNDAKERKSMDLDDQDKSGKNFDDLEDEDVDLLPANFGLFFALSMQMYQSTLVSDDSRFSQYARADGHSDKLNKDELDGFAIFQGKGHCINCHGGAELTNASFRNVIDKRLEVMVINGKNKTYDNGFYNIGVRKTLDDLGLGGTDNFGIPLSESVLFLNGKANLLGNNFDSSKYAGVPREVNVNGAFKTPGLHNVELTGPYFHNGGKATLMQVVDHYNRGGDFGRDNQENLDVDIQRLELKETEKVNLVKFLLTLTDERVRMEKAPFDHPSLCMPNGHTASGKPSDFGINAADDKSICINAVGSGGSSGIRPFMNLSPFAH